MNWDEMWKFVTNERHDGKKYLILQNMEGAVKNFNFSWNKS